MSLWCKVHLDGAIACDGLSSTTLAPPSLCPLLALLLAPPSIRPRHPLTQSFGPYTSFLCPTKTETSRLVSICDWEQLCPMFEFLSLSSQIGGSTMFIQVIAIDLSYIRNNLLSINPDSLCTRKAADIEQERNMDP